MTIYSLMRGTDFDRNTMIAVAKAFESVCRALDLSTRRDPITDVVGRQIIELARQGIKNPGQLAEAALAHLKAQGTRRAETG
jgi:hypothetical protein